MKLALYKSSRGVIWDKLIDIGTGLFGYSHNEIIFDQLFEKDPGGLSLSFSASGRDHGCRFKRINFDSGSWVVIDLPHSFEEEKAVYKDARGYDGLEYDYKGIFLTYVLWWVKKQDRKKWYCSEIGSKLLGWSNNQITPNKLARFYKAPKQAWSFKMVWEKDY